MEPSSIIILLARQRSGTNPLRSVLGSHPDIFCFPEVFNNRPAVRSTLSVQANYFNFVARHLGGDLKSVLVSDDHEALFLDYLEYLRCFTPKRLLLIDVKYMSTHHVTKAWRFISEEPYLFSLIKEHRLRVLNLRRTNYLRYCLSELKAQAAQQWTARDQVATAESDRPVNVPIDWLLRTMELCQSEDELVSRAFGEYDLYLGCDYKDLFEAIGGPVTDAVLHRIAGWLDVEAAFAERTPKFRKQSVLQLDEAIENYDEVVGALSGTPFAHCLEDEPLYHRSKREAGAPI